MSAHWVWHLKENSLILRTKRIISSLLKKQIKIIISSYNSKVFCIMFGFMAKSIVLPCLRTYSQLSKCLRLRVSLHCCQTMLGIILVKHGVYASVMTNWKRYRVAKLHLFLCLVHMKPCFIAVLPSVVQIQ